MYKITFQMASAISFVDPPVFDGIIAYAHAREILGDKIWVTKQKLKPEEYTDFTAMPIIQHPDGYYLTSIMQYNKEVAQESVQRWRKRWHATHEHMADFGKHKRKVHVQRGEDKSYDMPIRLLSVPEVWFFFESNDVDQVEKLISKHIFGIGKKRTVGHGEIAGFTIEEVATGPMIRQIPARFISTSFVPEPGKMDIRFTTWKPPYWDLDQAEVCVFTDISKLKTP